MNKNTIDLLLNNRQVITEKWIKILLEDDSLKEDITTNEDQRVQVEELVAALIKAFQNGNFKNIEADEYEEVMDIITDLSLSRAKQGYSPRETGMFIISLKMAFKNFLIESNTEDLLNEIVEINQLIDKLNIVSFDTY